MAKSMSSTTFQDDLARFGPDGSHRLDLSASLAWSRDRTRHHYENFSVLSGLVPQALRDDFTAFYAFCRTADDMADEIEDPEQSLELLEWFQNQLEEAYDGTPTHPALVAMAPTIRRHEIPRQPLLDLITAFKEDQRITRYDTWEQLLGYCSKSANPVGRVVLRILGEGWTDERLERSDAICTALQLTNHWQDVRGDLIDRDRVYIPQEFITIQDFEGRCRATAQQGWSIDGTFLQESRALIKRCVEETWPLYEKGSTLLPMLGAQSRPIIGLLGSGGVSVLGLIETWNYETVLHRPRIGRFTKFSLFMKAWLSAKMPGKKTGAMSVVSAREASA